MTVAVLMVCAALCAWARALEYRSIVRDRGIATIACHAIYIFFGAIAIGAGIQLTFRG